jgi:ubiquitin carboxyl-terminal hydrolase MINDY-1/2
MTYRLKMIDYSVGRRFLFVLMKNSKLQSLLNFLLHFGQGRDVYILLQNENGPCPLLAAANCLLLKGSITLPPRAIRIGVTSLEDLTNMLANYAMHSQQQQQQQQNQHSLLEKGEESSSSFFNTETQNQFSLNEFMNYIPNFQYGMDVNPKFTVGCQGYEYTAELSVLSDMLGCKLLHGWLIDPIQEEAIALAAGNKSYNELVERAIMGKEAEIEVSKIQLRIEEILQEHPYIDKMATDTTTNNLLDDEYEGTSLVAAQENLRKLRKQQCEMQNTAIEVHLIETFLADSSHQLTTYGLEQLHATIHDREICIMFRNNHFSTLTRHGDNLYLLVTDLGYANTSSIVWEKLDVVDGDTEFCDSYFICNPNIASIEHQSGPTLSPEQMMASSGQNDVDYQLAIQLSMQGDTNNKVTADTTASDTFYSNPSQSNISSGTIVALPAVPSTARVEVGIPISKPHALGGDQEAMDRMLALQLQQEHISIHSESDEEASLRLARQLHKEESAHAQTNVIVTSSNNGIASSPPNTQRIPSATAKANSNCAIM